MTIVCAPLPLRITRLIVGVQAAAALAWTVASSLYRGVDLVLAAPIGALLVVGGIGILGSRAWGGFVLFLAGVLVISICVSGGIYDCAIGLAIIVSALLALPGILPGFAPRHGR